MITKLTGLLVRVLDDEARVEVGPFEYQVLVPEAVRRVIQMRTGAEITFHVTEYLEGNSGGNRFVPRRIGFLTEVELDFFDLFCTVEKIGAKKALKAMARPVKEIADAINRQDSRWLSTLPGIGATTAEQIVTTLKRKVTKFLMAPTPNGDPAPVVVEAESKPGKRKPAANGDAAPASNLPDGRLVDDIYQALMGLGHSPIEARTRLDGLLSCGKAFRTLDEALTLIYATKG
jgi:holliday junction DNA helicase RuvA